MPNTPLILSDNLFDTTVLHPTFALGNYEADDAAGHEVFRLVDNLRDMTWWTPAGTNATRHIYVDCLTTQAPTMVVLDRGHNLAGQSVSIAGYTDATLGTLVGSINVTIPSTAGGLPSSTNGCLTPDGVWWKTFSLAAARVWTLSIGAMGAGVAPIVTGLYLGTYYRSPEFFNAPAAFDYKTDVRYLRNQVSRGGVRVKSRPLNYAKLPISVDMEASDYVNFEPHVRRLVQYNAPWWFCLDDSDSTLAGLLRLYQVQTDTTYDPQANPVHREVRSFELEEVIPRVYL